MCRSSSRDGLNLQQQRARWRPRTQAPATHQLRNCWEPYPVRALMKNMSPPPLPALAHLTTAHPTLPALPCDVDARRLDPGAPRRGPADSMDRMGWAQGRHLLASKPEDAHDALHRGCFQGGALTTPRGGALSSGVLTLLGSLPTTWHNLAMSLGLFVSVLCSSLLPRGVRVGGSLLPEATPAAGGRGVAKRKA
jgi:hypothetical protein